MPYVRSFYMKRRIVSAASSRLLSFRAIETKRTGCLTIAAAGIMRSAKTP